VSGEEEDMEFWHQSLHPSEMGRWNHVKNSTYMEDRYVWKIKLFHMLSCI